MSAGRSPVAERMSVTEGPEWSTLDDTTVTQAMTQKVCALPPGTPVAAAADYMRKHGIHRVLVMDGSQLLGIVSTSDISQAVADHKLTSRVYVFGSAQGNIRR